MPRRVVILADDLTGACDAAGTLTRYAAVRVAIDGHIPPGRVAAVDLDTRAADPGTARRRVARFARAVSSGALLYKKVDSQLRGNLVAELRGLLDGRPGPVLLVPALPEEGRVTVNGVHRIDGRRVALRRLLRELSLPLAGNNLPPPCGEGLREGVSLVSLPLAGRGGEGVSSLLVGDAARRQDLRQWARVVRQWRLKSVAGSAGLAAELPAAFGWRPRSHVARWRPARRVLVAVGSREARALEQLRWLARLRRRPIRQPGARRDILQDLRTGLALVQGEAPEQVLSRMDPAAVEGLVLCGGATARAALTRARATGLHLLVEIQPRMPLATIIGGRLKGRRVITKAGAFGPPHAFAVAVRALERGHV